MINILISDDNNDLVELIFKEIFRKNKNFRYKRKWKKQRRKSHKSNIT